MTIIDFDHIQGLEHIVVDGIRYALHVNIHTCVVHSAVIGLSRGGGYLPVRQWTEGIRAADMVLGDTSDIRGTEVYPHCALLIKHENAVVQIRTRKKYLIDLRFDLQRSRDKGYA